MSWQRISALLYRYLLLYRRSISRIADIVVWPISELILWGFVSVYLLRSGTNVPGVVGFFLGALILWDVFYRSQIGVTTNFLEDLWTKNLLNVFATPVRVSEFITAMVLFSFIRVMIGITIMSLLAWAMYGFQFLSIGLPLILFFANLFFMGISIGLMSVAIIIRLGQNAEILAWTIAIIFQPFSAVFYPVGVLPFFFRAVAQFVPAAHVFEGMRLLIATHRFSGYHLLWAVGLNIVYITASIGFFNFIFRHAKKSGRLVRTWQ